MKGALIGCGFFAQNQLHAWNAIDGVEIVALCDTNETRLAQTAETFEIERTYTNATDMFAGRGFDFVDIATTLPSHRLLVEMAANAGVHVICQKPFAKNLAEARAMISAVDIAEKILMVHENFRWQSPIRTALGMVRAGEIGNPFFGRFSFRSGYDVFSGQPYLAEGSRFIIEDLGIHILDIARAFFGDVLQLTANTKRINSEIKGEDVATMLLAHEEGASSIVDCSYATRRSPETFPQTLLELEGTHGTLRLDADYKLILHGKSELELDVSPAVLPWAEKPWHNIQESVLTIQDHFINCLAREIEPETSGADNLKTLTLVEAAYISAAKNRTVCVDEL